MKDNSFTEPKEDRGSHPEKSKERELRQNSLSQLVSTFTKHEEPHCFLDLTLSHGHEKGEEDLTRLTGLLSLIDPT